VNHIPEDSVQVINRATKELKVNFAILFLIISLHTRMYSESENKPSHEMKELFCKSTVFDGNIEALREEWNVYKEKLTREEFIDAVL
jgi:hypothetical protein